VIHLPHLETNVTAACQNRCISCNHFVPLTEQRPFMLDPAQMQRDLAIFSRFVHVGAYGMLGGEPTLHPKLPELIQIAKDSRIADRIEVWTNGQRVEKLPPAFWASPFDAMVLSRYPGKLTDAQLDEIAALCTANGKILEVKDEGAYPNFTRLLKPKPTRAQETYDACWFKTYSRVLDNGYFYRCCTTPYIPKLLLGMPEGTDGLRVDEHLTADAIVRFLNQRGAMQSCGICAGRNTPDAVGQKWVEIRDPKEWLDRSSGR
jgi:cyclic pyranopterin phosphate synthase